jgi:hypothetical protein
MDERKAEYIRRLKHICPVGHSVSPDTGSNTGPLPPYVSDLQRQISVLTTSLTVLKDQLTVPNIGRSTYLTKGCGSHYKPDSLSGDDTQSSSSQTGIYDVFLTLVLNNSMEQLLDLQTRVAQLESYSVSKRSDLNNEILTDGTRRSKKGRYTLLGERTDVLEGLAVEGVQEIQKLKVVDESQHREIVNLANVAGSAQDERKSLLENDNVLYTAINAEIIKINIRASDLENSLAEMIPYVKQLGGSVFGDFL